MSLYDKCGLFGVFGHPEAANLTYLGLYALQHRGQESAGIVSSDGERLFKHRAMGLVADIFTEAVLQKLPGGSAIGHVRYSTSGESALTNAQPFVMKYMRGSIAVAHNGNLVDSEDIRQDLEKKGSIFQSTMDTEVIMHLFALSRKEKMIDRLIDALSQVKGAYSLLFLTERQMIAARDPMGFRPLVLGKLKDAYVVASESCAFDLIEAEYLREIEPGEIVVFDEAGIYSRKAFPSHQKRFCIFEYIYFARPDSDLWGRNVYEVRKALGHKLAQEEPADVDIIVAVPDSGVPAAIGYSEETGIPLEWGMIRNHYVGRTFIEPSQSIRHFGVKIKLNAVRKAVAGKRVALIDDSIVRGTTSRKIVKMIRDSGATEVHLRISSPHITHPCFYGIDMPTRQELIASSHSLEEIRRYITCDSLGHLSLRGMLSVVKENKKDFCNACFSGDYPIEFPGMQERLQLPLFERIK